MNKRSLKKDKTLVSSEEKRIAALYSRVTSHIEQARNRIQKTVDIEMVKAYWLIGQDIVKEEQHGKERAEYGKTILKNLSTKLQTTYARGFGITTLEDIRKFYLTYQPLDKSKKSHALRGEFLTPTFNSNLSWTHYRLLMRITRPEARMFYEYEASKNHWLCCKF